MKNGIMKRPITKAAIAAGLGIAAVGLVAKSAWALYKRDSHMRIISHGQRVTDERVSEPRAVAEAARPVTTRFQRFILAEVKVKMGVPRYTDANLVLVRRAVIGTLLEERPDCRGTDLEKHVNVIVPLVFAPTDHEIALSQIMGDEFYNSWTWWTYRHMRSLLGRPIPMTPVERMNAYVRPPQ
jgi:hypothetical protein